MRTGWPGIIYTGLKGEKPANVPVRTMKAKLFIDA
jgi:hypothetical protein